jgi:EmrB/QacA subfamily drug resistance transporter
MTTHLRRVIVAALRVSADRCATALQPGGGQFEAVGPTSESREFGFTVVGASSILVLMSTETAPQVGDPAGARSDSLDRRVMIVAGVVVLGAVMSILDITVVAVAQRTFQDIFHATQAEVAWTATGYTLALATVIPLTGWAADRFGSKRLYILAIVLFTAGSALCATATSLQMLVTFRVLQGLGGGMLMPLGMTILTRAAGPERLGRVMAILGVPMLLGPIFGPILGGWLIDIASWHWIFLINVPIGIVAAIYAFLVLDRDEVHPSESFDFVGMLLLSPGLALFLYGVSSIPAAKQEHGTMFTANVVSTCAIGIVLIATFVWWALRGKNIHPLVQLRLFTNRYMTVAVLTMALFAIAFFGASLLFTLYFQQVRGESPLSSGWLVAPQGFGAMLTMPIAGFLADKIGPGKVVLTGLVLDTIGMGMLVVTDDKTPYSYLITSFVIMGLGMGATMMPVFTAALASLKSQDVARGSTLMNITQQISISLGTALFSVLLTTAYNAHSRVVGPTLALQNAGSPAQKQAVLDQLHLTPSQAEVVVSQGLHYMGSAFGGIFVVSTVLVGCCLIPAFFLPRKPADRSAAPAAAMSA